MPRKNSVLLVKETDFVGSSTNPVFPLVLKVQKLCNGDHNQPIKCEIWDHCSNSKHTYIGEVVFTISELLQDINNL